MNWLQKILCPQLNQMDQEISILKQTIFNDTATILDLQKEVDTLSEEKADLEEQVRKLLPTNPKEQIIENKYPQSTIAYQGRYLQGYGQMPMDVRGYFQNTTIKELTITESWSLLSDDGKALMAQKWVIDNITYTPDKTQFNIDEFWLLPQETLTTKKGDCDDGAILMANLLLASGIPYWKIRISAGDVYDKDGKPMGGHAFVTYYCEDKDKWVALDWCYYPDVNVQVENKPDYKDSILYGKGTVWFSFNSKHSFYKSTKTNTKLKKLGFIMR